MSNTNINMAKLKAIITSLSLDVSRREIAKNLGISDKTVRNYAKLIMADSLSFKELLELDEITLENRFCVGHSAISDTRFDYLKGKLDQYKLEWRQRHKTHVTKELLWREYRSDCKSNGQKPYGYTQFVFHLNQHLGVDPQSVTFNYRGEKDPGKYLEVDFTGDKMNYTNPITGEVVEVEIFVGVYPCTNALFAMPVPSQKVDDFIYCLDCCVRTMGTPRIIICDNLKSGVVKYERYDPKLNEAYESLCAHYGIAPFSARAYSPRDKAKVERHVQVVYNHIFAPLRNRQFMSFDEIAEAISAKLKQYMQSRPAGCKQTREEIFLSVEKPAFKDLNPERFELVRIKQLRVMSDSYIRFCVDKENLTLYSVPYQHIGKLVIVKYTRSMITIIDNKTVIAKHMRNDEALKVYDESHFPSYYGNYHDLSVEKFMQYAKNTGSEPLCNLLNRIFENAKCPELEFKHVQGLLHLQKISDNEVFDKACEISLKLDNLSYSFVSNLVKSKCIGYDYVENDVTFPSNEHENIRGRDYFSCAFADSADGANKTV